MRFTFLLTRIFLVWLGIAASGLVLAQTYPTKPVKIVVPYPPGGGSDLLARMMAQKLSEKWVKA